MPRPPGRAQQACCASATHPSCTPFPLVPKFPSPLGWLEGLSSETLPEPPAPVQEGWRQGPHMWNPEEVLPDDLQGGFPDIPGAPAQEGLLLRWGSRVCCPPRVTSQPLDGAFTVSTSVPVPFGASSLATTSGSGTCELSTVGPGISDPAFRRGEGGWGTADAGEGHPALSGASACVQSPALTHRL